MSREGTGANTTFPLFSQRQVGPAGTALVGESMQLMPIIEEDVVVIPEANIESNCCCLCGDKQKESRDGSGAIGATLGTAAILAAKIKSDN